MSDTAYPYRQTIRVTNETGMLTLGATLARHLPPDQRWVITLQGDLGAGKTTLVRGLLRELGHQGIVKSPTYTLVEPYRLAGRDIYHFDLYRVGEADELEYIGFRDYFSTNAVCLLEWPEQGENYVPSADINITISISNEARDVEIKSTDLLNINRL